MWNTYKNLKENCKAPVTLVLEKRSKFALFQGGNYILSSGAFSSGDFFIFETHPISLDFYQNNNGIVVPLSSPTVTWQWTTKQLQCSGVNNTCTPSFVVPKLRCILLLLVPDFCYLFFLQNV